MCSDETRRGASQHLIVCEASSSSSSSLPSSPLYHYTLRCLQGFVAVAVSIQRLNRSGQRWPTWDEKQEEGEDAEAHTAAPSGLNNTTYTLMECVVVFAVLVGLQCVCVKLGEEVEHPAASQCFVFPLFCCSLSLKNT